MVSKMVRAAVIAAVYTGTVIGAGFASGQEIWYFFSRYGPAGTRGLFLSTVLLSLLGAKAMEWGRRIGASSYHDFLNNLAGKWPGRLGDLAITVFLLLLLGVMLAGSGAVAVEWGGKWEWGCWATAGLAVLVLSRRLEGIKGVNLVVIPLLFGAGIILNLQWDRAYFPLPLPLPRAFPGGWTGTWWTAALQYSAYNLVLALPVLVTLYRLDDNPATLRRGGILGGVSLGVLAFLFHRILMGAVSVGELPLFFLTREWSGWWRYGYGLVLWGELFSTLIAHGYGLATRLGPAESPRYILRVTSLLLFAMVIGRIGFARLVTNVYPLFGVVCFLLLLPLCFRPLPPNHGKVAEKPVFSR